MKTIILLFFLASVFIAGAKSFKAPEIPGWEQEGEIKVFEQNNLFNHINGAAEFYFSYDFQKLWVVHYSKGEAELSIEVYDQNDPVHAFGIYSMERPPEADVTEIGAQGYYEENILNFVSGRYYVKMNSYREPNAGSGVLLTTANEISKSLCDNPQLPLIIEAMPADSLVLNSRQFVSNTFMGLEFLGSAYRSTYQTDKGKLTLFVLERSSADQIETILRKYHEFVQADVDKLIEGDYVIEDPFNGTIYLHWIDNYIIGFSGDDLNSLRSELLQKMESALDI